MKIKLFGTAAAEGIPALFCNCEVCINAIKKGGKEIRTRSQALINDDLLIDFPGDSFLHKIRDGLNLTDLEHLLITHSHHDHLFAEDLMMRMEGYGADIDTLLTVYGNNRVKEFYERAQNLEGFRDDKRIVFKEIHEFVPFKINKYEITPLLADHAKNEKSYIYQIKQENKSLLYGHDSGIFPESVWEYWEKNRPYFDLVILDCTHQIVPVEGNHMSFKDNIFIKEKFIELGYANQDTNFVITHFSHNGKLTHKEIEKWAEINEFIAAYDGIEVEI